MPSFRLPAPLQSFYDAVMARKHDDHHASHTDPANQLLHLVSSSAFLVSYVLIFSNELLAMWIGVPALLLRQFGHAVLEPDAHDAEKLLLGYNTRNKSMILLTYLLLPLVALLRSGAWSIAGFVDAAPGIAHQWFLLTAAVVIGRMIFLVVTHNVGIALVWLVKLVTDPLTDLLEYRPWRVEGRAA